MTRLTLVQAEQLWWAKWQYRVSEAVMDQAYIPDDEVTRRVLRQGTLELQAQLQVHADETEWLISFAPDDPSLFTVRFDTDRLWKKEDTEPPIRANVYGMIRMVNAPLVQPLRVLPFINDSLEPVLVQVMGWDTADRCWLYGAPVPADG